MLTRNDCFLLLSEISEKGIDTSNMINKLVSTNKIDSEIIKFINNHRSIDIIAFYEKLRKSYHNHHSKLYKEIVQIDEKEPKDIIVTLSCLLTQILLFSNNVQDRMLFLKHSRADEISTVLYHYFKDYDIKRCVTLLMLIRADLKCFEQSKN